MKIKLQRDSEKPNYTWKDNDKDTLANKCLNTANELPRICYIH